MHACATRPFATRQVRRRQAGARSGQRPLVSPPCRTPGTCRPVSGQGIQVCVHQQAHTSLAARRRRISVARPAIFAPSAVSDPCPADRSQGGSLAPGVSGTGAPDAHGHARHSATSRRR